MGYAFRLTARVLLYASSHTQDNTYHGLCYTSRGAQAGLFQSISLCVTAGITLSDGLVSQHFLERAFAHGAMGRRIDPSWGGPFLTTRMVLNHMSDAILP